MRFFTQINHLASIPSIFSFAPLNKLTSQIKDVGQAFYEKMTAMLSEDVEPFYFQAQREPAFIHYQQWHGDFKRAVRIIFKMIRAGRGISPQALQKFLLNFQANIEENIYSPFDYHALLTELIAKTKNVYKLPAGYGLVLQEGCVRLKDQLREKPQLALHYFYQDLINHLIQYANRQISLEQFISISNYYDGLVPHTLQQAVTQQLNNLLQQYASFTPSTSIYEPLLSNEALKSLIYTINQAFRHIFEPVNNKKLPHEKAFAYASWGTICSSPKTIAALTAIPVIAYLVNNYSEHALTPNLSYQFAELANINTAWTLSGILPLTFHAGMQYATHLLSTYSGSSISSTMLHTATSLLILMPYGKAQPTPLTSEFLVNTYTIENQFPESNKAVAGLTNNNFVVAWASYNQDGDQYGVYGQIFNSTGQKVGNELQINTYTTNSQYSYAVTALANSNFVVTWDSYGQDGNFEGVYAQIFDISSNKVGGEFRVNTNTINTEKSPTIASFNDSHFVVAYEGTGSRDGSLYAIFAQLFDEWGAKVGGEFQVNTYWQGRQTGPFVATFKNDNFVIAWTSEDQDGSFRGVYAQLFYSSGSKRGSEFRINLYTTNSQFSPRIATMNNNNFVAVWSSYTQDGYYEGVYGQIFNEAGTRVGNEFRINTYTQFAQYGGDVIVLNNNHFFAAWMSEGQDGSEYGIYGQEFDESANKIGNEMLMTTTTINNQFSPSLGLLNDGNFVVIWAHDTDPVANSNIWDVYGRIFSPTLTSATTTALTTTTETTGDISTANNPLSPDIQNILNDVSDNALYIGAGAGALGLIILISGTSYCIYRHKSKLREPQPAKQQSNDHDHDYEMQEQIKSADIKQTNVEQPMALEEVVTKPITPLTPSLTREPVSEIVSISNLPMPVNIVSQQRFSFVPKPDLTTPSHDLPQPISAPVVQRKSLASPSPDQLNRIDYSDLKLKQEIGRGGFGTVYYGKWKDVEVAVKQLTLNMLSEEAYASFEKEMIIMARLRFPNIVQFYGACLDQPYYCLVMEYMAMGSLAQVLLDQKIKLPWTQREQIAIDIGRGLEYLHSEKIVHRDLKSANVLLTKQFQAKLSDFGLSKIKSETRTTTKSANHAVGTLPWMPPELIAGKAYTPKSDMYSFGMVLWEIAAREKPYKNVENAFAIPLMAAQNTHDEIPATTPIKFASLIRFCWNPDPDQRPGIRETLQQLKADKEEISEVETNEEIPPAYGEAPPDYEYNIASQSGMAFPSFQGNNDTINNSVFFSK